MVVYRVSTCDQRNRIIDREKKPQTHITCRDGFIIEKYQPHFIRVKHFRHCVFLFLFLTGNATVSIQLLTKLNNITI